MMNKERAIFDPQTLNDAGLNLHAIFDLAALPESMINDLQALFPDFSSYQQLILFAHGGRELWPNIRAKLAIEENPIDDYSINTVTNYFKLHSGVSSFQVIYPSQKPVGLQAIGELAGWHHSSPFRVGINQQWGSWFAYRVAVLTDSNFQTTVRQSDPSPCITCESKPCISACPANALDNNFSLQACLNYRKQADSQCRDRCLARMSCPVAKKHQYDLEQINYHYGISMKMIETLNL